MAGYRSYGKHRSYGGNSYGSRYGSGGSHMGYSYGGSWNYWGSYFEDFNENNEKLVVKEPLNYATPSKADIQAKYHVWREGGVDQIKELARVCYFKMIGDKDYFKEAYSDLSTLSEDNAEAIKVKKELYDSIYDTFIPGFTPLDQAIAIYQQMSNQTTDNTDSEKMDLKLMQNVLLDFDRKTYTDPTINDQLELNEHSKNRKMSILDKVSIVGKFGTQFKVEKEVDEKIVSNSDTYAKKMMRDYAQMAQVDLYQRLFPNFPVKLLMKDLVVSVPVDRKEQKQKIIIILDFSGSMDESFKQDWVNAILIDRFRYVLQGEAEVFFSYFVHNPENMHFHHIHDKESVMAFWQMFSNEPDGGTTYVGSMVNRISSEIKWKRLMNLDIDLSEEKPEILVINDGDDEIDAEEFPYKVNAICLGQMNPQLKDLCVATKGKKVYVDWDNKITSFSESGEEIIK